MSPPSPDDAALLDDALAVARAAHHGQTRRHGAPYITHPQAVADLAMDLGRALELELSVDLQAVALLHDVIEDSDIDRAALERRFGPRVGNGVDLLTKVGKGPEATAAYYARLAREGDDALRLIKASDRIHNLSELHLAPDTTKLRAYIDETLAHVVPLAAGASAPVAAGLVAALHDAIRAAARAQGLEAPAPARLDAQRPTADGARAVPLGVYGIVAGVEPAHVRDLLVGGVAMLQLRAKGRTDRDVMALASALAPLCREARVPLVVNDRPDLARASRADGVHVGQTDLPPHAARQILGDAALVGASSHTEDELLALNTEGAADLVAVGPVFLSPTKQGHAPVVGLEALARRCALSRLPVVAIGGITTPERVAACARAGAALVATVSALEGTGARAMLRRMSAAFFAARAHKAALTTDPAHTTPVSAP